MQKGRKRFISHLIFRATVFQEFANCKQVGTGVLKLQWFYLLRFISSEQSSDALCCWWFPPHSHTLTP